MSTKHRKTVFIRPVLILIILVVAFWLTTGVTTWRAAAQEPELTTWRDDFDGDLAEDWYWVNNNVEKWSLNENPGYLRIYAAQNGTGSENLLLRPMQGDFAIETHVFFAPDTNFQFAGLAIWQDGANFLQFGRAFCDVEGPCVGNGIYFDRVIDGSGFDSPNFATPVDSPDEAYLRLERRGEMVRAFYSYEGITWFEIGTHWIPGDFQVNEVGLTASQDVYTPDWDIPADFDYFELTEGWGFLPEGFHDYDQGDVPSWACNAGGWAADPDDRAVDLAIEINVDGTSLSDWLYASEYREDLDNAGVCEDGNCGFSTSLWGTISSYEPHTVVAYAQDIPSGEWVRLSSSPKPLTCRTYDIYAYDPLTGTTRQITDLRDADEYNPSWSPNGKLVAHDVLAGDQHDIYITDVKTGVSTPLNGAEGGNDAVWSQNGKWIAFDGGLLGDQSLYILPSAGGTRTLVRGNGVSAGWAPNGKRLVFQDTTDGSIRTVPVDGGKGGETFIAASGANPSWSPDGSWIAYEFNGDIWKVPVNVLGKVLGKPVQVTSLFAGEGQPTWSADSQTIVYHAGLSRDYDLWSVPAAGGQPTWLTGAPEFGDYDPAYAKNSANIAYASFSPEGQAPRHWGSTFTYDLPAGTWAPGDHSYYFENTFTFPESDGGATDPVDFAVLEGVEAYDGYALLRPWAIQAHAWGECRYIDAINPFQATRFLYGWVTDDLLAYQEAVAHFDSMAITAYWDDGMSASLTQRHEIYPLSSEVDMFGYRCSFTEPPPMFKVQITDNWFEAQRFLPNTELIYQIYDSPGGNLLLDGVMGSDDNGTAGVWVGDQVDLVPGQYIIVSDGYSTKDILLEPITFDLINTDTGHAEGTAPGPFGRTIWVGIGFPDAGWDRWVPTDGDGNWTAEFEQPIPTNFEWIAAWAFDADGDISEVRPEQVLGTWVAVYHYIRPAGAWDEGDHNYYISSASEPGELRTFSVSGDAPLYDGYALLRWGSIWVKTGEGCQNDINTINPAQLTRFHYGFLSEGSMTYDEAVAYFSSQAPFVVWDGGEPVDLLLQEIRLYSPDTWWDYVCDATTGPPEMALRVNFGHDWVESFYEAGHEVVITVTDSEGNEKATATVFTEPKDFWGGATGFQTNPEDWSPAQPDIQPYDWVYASVDNGAAAQVQIGEINGMIDLEADSIEGTINAIWFSDPVNVECFPWGSPDPVDMKFDATSTNGEDTFSCSWSGEWDIDYYQDVGVGYFGLDGHWVANAFFVRNPRFVVFPEWEWFDGLDWPDGATVSITVDGKPECTTSKESWGGFFNGNFGEGCDLEIGDTVTFTDGVTTRTHVVRNLAIKAVDIDEDTVTGRADPGAEVHVWPHATGQELLDIANPGGNWKVDFTGIFDLLPGEGGRSEIRDEFGNATAVDWYIPNPRIVASITEDWFYVLEFAPNTTVEFSIYTSKDGTELSTGTTTTDGSGFAWVNAEGNWDLEPGNYLAVSDGTSAKQLVVEGFTFDVFDLTLGRLQGTAPEPSGRRVWVGIGFENDGWSMDVFTDEAGNWLAELGSPITAGFYWVAAQIFDEDGDASELRPASQVIFLRPVCGFTYTVQAGSLLEIRYGSWVAIGEELANQNADYLTVELLLNGETVTGNKQPVVPRSEFPCGAPPEDAYGVYYVTHIGPLDPGTYTAKVTWIFDEAVTDGYDADGDGEPDWYGPGEVVSHEFTIFIP